MSSDSKSVQCYGRKASLFWQREKQTAGAKEGVLQGYYRNKGDLGGEHQVSKISSSLYTPPSRNDPSHYFPKPTKATFFPST